jgi:amino acid transporter
MTDEKLIRGIGRWDFTSLVVNTIIGAGIFGLPSKVYAQIGTYSLLAFVLCAVIVGLIAICYAEVSSRFSTTGGAYLYAREALGTVAGFEVGWLYWIVRVVTPAANCNLFVTYLGFFYKDLAEGWARIGVIAIVVIGIGVVNFIGVRQSAALTNFFTAGKLIPIFIFVIIGLAYIQPANFSLAAVPENGSFTTATLLLIYAFVGYESAVVMAGEVRDPKRNIPFGLLSGVAFVALIYILIQVVCIGTLPDLARSERPLAEAAAGFMGNFGASLITVGALLSILGNLNVGLMAGARLLFSLGEHRDLPVSLAATHPRFRTPHISIAVTTLAILVLTIQSSFLSAVAIATITRLIVYATTCFALIIFRRRKNVPDAMFTAPFGVVAAVLSLVLIGWLLTNVDFAKECLPILISAAIGLAIYATYRLFGPNIDPEST